MSVPPNEDLPPADKPHRLRLTRRRFLVLAGAGFATLIGAIRLAGGGARRPPAPPLASFPVLNVESSPPVESAGAWVLSVGGMVGKPLRIDRTAWEALPRRQETADFQCVEGWSVDELHWEGVWVAEVLRQAAPRAKGRYVTFHAYDGSYSDSLTLAEASAAETILADALDGRLLPPVHGGPLRLVVPSQLGYKNVKWVVRLEGRA